MRFVFSWLIICSMLLASLNINAQDEGKKGARTLLGDAKYFFDNELYIQALPLYLEAEQKKPGDKEVNLNIGICYLNSNDQRNKALPYLEYASKQEGVSKDVFYYLGRALHLNYELDKAIVSFQTFIQSIPEKGNERFVEDAKHQIEMCNNAIELISKPVNVKIENLGPVINTPFPDYVPVISADESMLIFTSRRPGTTGGKTDTYDMKFYEDIYISTKINDSVWNSPVSIGAPINTDQHDATVGLSADGQQLFVYRLGDIYYCNLVGDQWSPPIKFTSDVNTRMWEPSASISADGSVLYFSSDRKGGEGGRDIWRVKKLPNGEWSFSQNLGATVNTKYDEDGPFIHPDGKTLYFSSDGHKSMGGFDIFSTEILEGNTWSEPVNIGYPVNTTDDDIYYVLSAEGKHGYYSSIRNDSYGEKDIYRITFPEVSIPLTVMRGYIYGSDKMPIGAKIVVTDNENGELIGIFRANSSTGKYIIILPPGKNYNFSVEGEESNDYLFYSKNINIPNQAEFKVIEDSILLKEIKVGEKTVLRNLFFDTDKSELRPESRVELDRIYKLMMDNPIMKVEISGHTDDVGSKKYNQKLSEKRANSVVEYLYERGIQKKKLVPKGYGETKPLAKNDTEEGKQENRRSELEIIELDETLESKTDILYETNLDVLYKIQVATSNKLLSYDSPIFKGLNGVTTDSSENEVIRYVVGSYSGYNEAAISRDQIKKEYGILDCFVVAYYGNKRISLKDAKRLTTKF